MSDLSLPTNKSVSIPNPVILPERKWLLHSAKNYSFGAEDVKPVFRCLIVYGYGYQMSKTVIGKMSWIRHKPQSCIEARGAKCVLTKEKGLFGRAAAFHPVGMKNKPRRGGRRRAAASI